MSLKRIRRVLTMPILNFKWEMARRSRIESLRYSRKSPEALFEKTNEAYKRFLEFERMNKDKELIAYVRGQLHALKWVSGQKEDLVCSRIDQD